MIDLHTHSTASDGTYSPSALTEYAISQKISVFALCDHDTLAGIPEALKTAKNRIHCIPGIELNIDYPSGECHLLGLGISQSHSSLHEIISTLQQGRIERNKSILNKMQEDGLPVSYAELHDFAHSATIGRPHIASYLISKNIIKNSEQAFDKYLGKGRVYYIDRFGANLDDAVQAIVKSGGVPVLAHPLSLYISWGKIEVALKDFYDRGVQAIEAWHPAARVNSCMRLEELGKKIGFKISAGSDFHGNVRTERRIGHTAGGRAIEERFWTEEIAPLFVI